MLLETWKPVKFIQIEMSHFTTYFTENLYSNNVWDMLHSATHKLIWGWAWVSMLLQCTLFWCYQAWLKGSLHNMVCQTQFVFWCMQMDINIHISTLKYRFLDYLKQYKQNSTFRAKALCWEVCRNSKCWILFYTVYFWLHYFTWCSILIFSKLKND